MNSNSSLLREILSTYYKGNHSPLVVHKDIHDKSTFSGEISDIVPSNDFIEMWMRRCVLQPLFAVRHLS